MGGGAGSYLREAWAASGAAGCGGGLGPVLTVSAVALGDYGLWWRAPWRAAEALNWRETGGI